MLNSLPKNINEIHLFLRYDAPPSCYPGICHSDHISTYGVSLSLFSLRNFTNLRSLTIRFFNITNIIQEISKKTTLVYLDLQKCQTHDKIFTFNQLSNLEHLNIKDVSFVDSHMKDIPNPLSGIFNACKNLKHLDAPDFDVDLAEIKMENWVNLRNLVYLNIRWQASDAVIEKIIKYCNKLEFINTGTLNSGSIIKLTKLENFNYLILHRTNSTNKVNSNKLIVAVLNNCKKLKHLEIYGSTKVEALIFNDLSKLQYIESLNLEFSCKLKDPAIIAIAKNFKLLKCLNIGGCDITSNALIALTSLKNLKELNVAHNDNIEDNFIVKLRGIKSLNCSVCKKLTDAGVIQFIKNNPDLEFLNISFNTNVTMDTIIAAEEAVKNRINDTFLSIRAHYLNLDKAYIKPQWLIYC
ncbi:uncharacterized protein LOC122849337 [Aphidius gifuensis]|uniref:uncharacterized protein LOC122849337 n=1 Tax=Aphidius gifuensis TaxID=684658 RepID=UPI001CDC7A6D|nr:uncharacterized protein LOC122849337 [Aphidius gifuensis]